MEGKNNVAMSRRYNQPGRRKWREAETRNSVRCRRTVGAGGWRKVNPGGCGKPGHSQVTEPPTFQRAASTANKTYDPSVRAIVGKLIRSIVEFYSIRKGGEISKFLRRGNISLNRSILFASSSSFVRILGERIKDRVNVILFYFLDPVARSFRV